MVLDLVMISLLWYQITMPAVDNGKYMIVVNNGQIVRMNTQDGTFEVCDQTFKCRPPEQSESK